MLSNFLFLINFKCAYCNVIEGNFNLVFANKTIFAIFWSFVAKSEILLRRKKSGKVQIESIKDKKLKRKFLKGNMAGDPSRLPNPRWSGAGLKTIITSTFAGSFLRIHTNTMKENSCARYCMSTKHYQNGPRA